MHKSVRDAFVRFTEPLEGKVPFLYCDIKGLVTVAIGNLVDPVAYALTLPFRRQDGTLATPEEIRQDWERVKARQDMRLRGGMAYRSVAQLRLDDEGIQRVVERKLDQNEDFLRRRFSDWDEWPADAQLATHSMAWACGPGFRFPMLEAALKAQQFGLAAVECRMQEKGNPGIVPRNKANRVLYFNASAVVREGWDRSVLHWPADLAAERPTDPAPVDAADMTPSEPTVEVRVPTMRPAPMADVIVHPKVIFPARDYSDDPDDAA